MVKDNSQYCMQAFFIVLMKFRLAPSWLILILVVCGAALMLL